ncbi:MAG: primosomal protein N' family DNA-binding protein [Acidimicrobiales bacterium]
MSCTVEVLPDVTGLDRTFHYSSPEPVTAGTIVRVRLQGRRVRGYVVGVDTPVPPGVELQPLLEVVSLGPPPEVVDLCRWASWRWSGRLRTLLLAASPGRVVREGRQEPSSTPARPVARAAETGPLGEAVRTALQARDAILRLPPAAERLPLVEAFLAEMPDRARGALVLVESHDDAGRLSARLSRSGWTVASYPEDWAAAAAGSSEVVIGTRNAALAPLTPALTVVLDAHSESYRSERVPTFDARAITAERARRTGSRVVFVTPCPSVELLEAPGRRLVTVPRAVERAGWGTIGVLDSRTEDPAEGGYPSLAVAWIREAVAAGAGGRRRPVVCILNRVGRARLLTCGSCKAVQRCARCGAAQVQLTAPRKGEIGLLSCPRCRQEQQAICQACGSAALRVVRSGVTRARDQLEAVTGLEVGQVSGPRSPVPATPVIIGTQAVLHRLRGAALVVWLDFDQELLVPRFRGAEQALALLARSVRLVGARPPSLGRVVVRTSMPGHEVVQAAQLGDPDLVATAEKGRRELLLLPPFSAMARIDGAASEEIVARLPAQFETTRLEGGFLVRAPSSVALADALAELVAGEAGGWAALGARVEVDPVDV